MTAPGVVRAAVSHAGDLDLSAAVDSVMTKVTEDRVAERAAAKPKAPSRRKQLLAALLFPVFVGTTAYALLTPATAATISPAAEARAARFQLWLASRNVDAFYDSAGVWPETVGAIGVDTGTVSYRRSTTGYVVAIEASGRTWSHESGDATSKAELNATADSVLQRGVR